MLTFLSIKKKKTGGGLLIFLTSFTELGFFIVSKE